MTTPLHRATVAYKRALAVAEQRRLELADEIFNADQAGTRQIDIVAATGYTREHIRRIVVEAKKQRESGDH